MRRPYWHELSLGGFALATGLALLLKDSVPLALLLLGGTAAFTVAAALSPPRVRLALAYLFALGLYQSVRFVVPALSRTVIDAQLAEADLWIFGSAPSTWISPGPVLTELLSAAYLSYQLYLHGALAHALTRPIAEATHLFETVFAAMGVGFAGYVLFPALGPAHAHFDGGPLTAINAWVVSNGSSVFDAFPSLHVAITAMLLAHDAKYVRRRFLVMLPIAVGLVVSTLYLRYHHAVDLLAGAALATAVVLALRAQGPRSSPA